MTIQSGTFKCGFSDPYWTLNTGTGPRSYTSQDIRFNQPFTTTPTVMVSLCGVDAGNSANLRLWISATDVDPGEFNVVFQTLADSVIYTGWVSWIAYTP